MLRGRANRESPPWAKASGAGILSHARTRGPGRTGETRTLQRRWSACRTEAIGLHPAASAWPHAGRGRPSCSVMSSRTPPAALAPRSRNGSDGSTLMRLMIISWTPLSELVSSRCPSHSHCVTVRWRRTSTHKCKLYSAPVPFRSSHPTLLLNETFLCGLPSHLSTTCTPSCLDFCFVGYLSRLFRYISTVCHQLPKDQWPKKERWWIIQGIPAIVQ